MTNLLLRSADIGDVGTLARRPGPVKEASAMRGFAITSRLAEGPHAKRACRPACPRALDRRRGCCPPDLDPGPRERQDQSDAGQPLLPESGVAAHTGDHGR